MTTVSNNVAPSSLVASMNSSRPASGDSVSETQDRFMTLLVAQMKNQDPLNPLDNAQVTSQMAQLSTVTGVEKLNVTVQALQESYQASQSLAAVSMIGRGVFVPGSDIALQEGKAIFGVEMTESADEVTVEIRSAAGQLVHTIDLGAQSAGNVPLAWDGKTDSGATAKDGSYTFNVKAVRGGEEINVATGLSFGEVASVSNNAQGTKLHVAGIGAVQLSAIREVI
ncbi:flagellar hook assembly protein FlgD [Oxalobacteraceae bacterium R-40]|uniref:Basal-body rod modification protein FlgD n=1 Tax=Keguizhuia sedimenti TaxID=3064264 RepID=A0ABU1BPA9_9BURK|nr:flagellar hook assembly protein FlgD [Oxalobacteraceae bacterium R-40]